MRRIQSYYEAIGARESGYRAVQHVFERCQVLVSFPYLGTVVEGASEALPSYRKIIVEKYAIYYTVEDDQVVIAAVMDGRKDPQDLENRLK